MSFKISKKDVENMETVEVIKNFELCCTALTHECNSLRGQNKQTLKSRDILLNELLDRVGSTKTYDSDYKIVDRIKTDLEQEIRR